MNLIQLHVVGGAGYIHAPNVTIISTRCKSSYKCTNEQTFKKSKTAYIIYVTILVERVRLVLRCVAQQINSNKRMLPDQRLELMT